MLHRWQHLEQRSFKMSEAQYMDKIDRCFDLPAWVGFVFICCNLNTAGSHLVMLGHAMGCHSHVDHGLITTQLMMLG